MCFTDQIFFDLPFVAYQVAVTMKVGWSRNTKAKYFVRNVAEVKRLLEAIAMVEKEKVVSVTLP